MSRFDGVEFENFGLEDGLTSRIVCHISEGYDGKIYILCDHGFSIFDGKKLIPYPFPDDIRAYMINTSVVHDQKGSTWLSFRYSSSWYFLNFDHGVYLDALKIFHLPDTLKVNNLKYDDTDNSLYFGTEESGIGIIHHDSISIIPVHFSGIRLLSKVYDTLIFTGRTHGGPGKLIECTLKNPDEYEISVDKEVNPRTLIPRMIIETHVENALKHGLVHSDKKGMIKIEVKKEDHALIIEITDNGIGREKAREYSKNTTRLGLKVTEQFYTLINKYNKEKITRKIIDLYDDAGHPAGTRVIIRIPEGMGYEW